MRWAVLAVAMGLGACVVEEPDDPGPAPGGGVIEWSSGGSFGGGNGGRLLADDSAVTWTMPPFGRVQEAGRQMQPGTFAAALSYLRANPIGPLPEGPACPDYGTDSVAYSGPGPDIRHTAMCPNDALIALQRGLLETISAAQ